MSKIKSFLRLAMAVRNAQGGHRRPPPRKPPNGSAPQPAVSPSGPLPLEGGAAATID